MYLYLHLHVHLVQNINGKQTNIEGTNIKDRLYYHITITLSLYFLNIQHIGFAITSKAAL
jgi:hypothetical protein